MVKKIQMTMKIKCLLTILLLVSALAGHSQIYNVVDTLDEEDYIARRDTMIMSRKNVALDEGDPAYGIDFIIDDRYRVSHEKFKGSIWDQWYLGGGVGFEMMHSRSDIVGNEQLTNFYLTAGKQFTPYHSLRFSLGGAFFYNNKKDFDYWFARGTGRVDYLYDLSTHILGYSASRRVNVSLLAGLGGNVVNSFENKLKFVPDVRTGMQFRIFTGPRCYLNVEPYVQLSGDQLDVDFDTNWRKYDIMYGVNLNFQYYLSDPLSPQAKLRLLQSRGDGTTMVDKRTVDNWRTPWFFGATVGPVFGRAANDDITVGSATTFSVGRWFSPVLGARLTAATRTLVDFHLHADATTSGFSEKYNSHYNSGRIDFLLNPFGFSRNFSWDDSFGANIVVGAELGSASYHDLDGQRPKYFGQSVSAGINIWTKLTDDLRFFVEPRFTHNTYTRITSIEGHQRQFCDNLPSVDIGLTMLIRSEKFHELDEFDDVQNYMHSYVRGFRVGALGGFSLLHLRNVDYGRTGFYWDALAYLEYRFTHLHSVLAFANFMNFKHNALIPSEHEICDVENNLLIASLDYEISVTNFLSGILRHRWCELEAFAGPSVGYVVSRKGFPSSYYPDNGLKWGFNGGFKLSKHIWNGISFVVMPEVYFLRNLNMTGITTVGINGFNFFQTVNFGLQYKIGSVHRNAARVRTQQLQSDSRWAERQQKSIRKAEAKQRRHNEKMQQRYDNSHTR